MNDSFSKLTIRFYQLKETQDKHLCVALIKDLQDFIEKYQQVTDVHEQAMLAEAIELQLVLYVLIDEREKAEQLEKRLDDEFFGIHRIGKSLNKENNQLITSKGGLNISLNLLDFNRLNQLAIKQKGATKPKLLVHGLMILGIILFVCAIWLFSIHWIWTPLIIGVIGVLLITISSRVGAIINRFFNTIAFEAGIIIPGMITKVNENSYEAVFMAPLMTQNDQADRWGITYINFKKAAGHFTLADKLAAVCVFEHAQEGYYPNFIPTPICLGFYQRLIQYKAMSIIDDVQWQRLKQIIDKFPNTQGSFTVNQQLEKI